MALAHIIQQAWQQQSAWLKLLRPLSCLYGALFHLNKSLYQKGFKQSYRASIPVMVIGNITVGGSGKTPLLIEIVRYLQQNQIKVGVISRGYGGKGIFPALVEQNSLPEQVGDEPCLIVQATQVPMAVGANRQQAIELLLKHHDLQIIISDDGLQHWALQRDIEWIVYDAVRGLGNEQLLPEGYLREPKSRLEHATVIEHSPHSNARLNMHLAVAQPYALFDKTQNFNAQQKFHVVVGIGYPQRFYTTLRELGVDDVIYHEFADHHQYTLQDIDFNDDLPIITTEKDAVKLKPLLQGHSLLTKIWVVPVQAVLSLACYQTLQQQLAQFNISMEHSSCKNIS